MPGPYLFSWYMIVAVMTTAFLVTGGTRLGYGVWYLFTNQHERDYLLKSFRPAIDGSSLWILMTTVVLFSLFPRIFRVLFTGLYPVIAVILIALGLRIMALMLRGYTRSRHLKSVLDVFISLGNIAPLFLLGLIAGYILKGISLYDEGQFNVNVMGYVNYYSFTAGLLILFSSAAMSFAAIAVNCDGNTQSYARRSAFYSSMLSFMLILDLGLWSFIMSPYITESLQSNRTLILVPSATFIASACLPVLLWKRRYRISYVVAVIVTIGLAATFFLTIFPHLREIFGRPGQFRPDMLLNRGETMAMQGPRFREIAENRKIYMPVFLFLMAATGYFQYWIFRYYHRRAECTMPYDGEYEDLI